MHTKYSNQTMPNMTPSQSICCIILSFNIIRDTINNKDMRTTWYNWHGPFLRDLSQWWNVQKHILFHDTCIENIRIIQVESYNCWQQMLLHRCLYLNWINYSLCVIGDERQLILIKFWWTKTVWLIISSTAVLLNSTYCLQTSVLLYHISVC